MRVRLAFRDRRDCFGATLWLFAWLIAASVAEPVYAADGDAFKDDIAPLLARHCLDCHGWKSTKGKLDLSHKDAAFAGGKSGKAIVPGKADQSKLWKMVHDDEMPEDRPPLSAREKATLKKWIDDGAAWTIQKLDRAAFAPADTASASWIRRLTVPEYILTVQSATGVDIAPDAMKLLPRDLRADGFSNTAYNLNVDLEHVEAYARLAAIIVSKMDVPTFAKRFTSETKLDDAHLRKAIGAIGTWLLRGPLEDFEVAAFLRVAHAVKAEGGDFHETVAYIVEAMLQSPRFIYRIEKQPADGKAKPVGSYELASRLSYIVWGGPPDEELLRAAGAGELSDRAKLAAQVKRMLADPRAVDRSLRFAYEWLDLGRLDNLRPNESRYPTWDPQLAMDMREETLAYFKHVVWDQKRPMWDLLNAQVTFATPRLAEHYGLKEDWIAADNSQRDTSDRPRSSKGLIALYTFREGGGDVVRDVSGAGEPLNLKIESVKAVEWSSDGLKVKDTTLIATGSAPRRLIDALKKSNEITLEAWITPADTKQEGPARILTLSQSSSARNFTLGQERDQFDVRFRTTKTSTNGIPSVSTPGKTVETKKVHVAYTRDATGRAKLYIDGQQKAAGNIDGDLGNWDAGMRLALGNELTRDRNWRGTFHRVAIYDRALSQAEIQAQTFGPSRYDLSKFPARGGLLTHGSVLTIGGDDASMVTRGLFVLHDLLRGHVDDPPPGLDTSPVPTKPGQSHRVIAEQRIANPQCGGCHRAFEPLAFGLERYDGIGAYFEKDKHGNRLREDGQIVLPGEDQPKSYRTSAELMDLLAGSDRVRKTLTWKVAQWAMGRPMREADSPLLDTIYADAAKNGGTYESLIAALAMSDLVRMTHTESKP